ncbi:thiolase family protein [Pseudonocardia sp. RS11V-5]|uniref:thiolase family protein n=1 Tax=Pseudonocardia terrae TaxID=2905831 RepID=UPI001E33FAA3|nr:thiolase family protein [Pseudonocardia terrae]MCE3555927.1 thiolase family protein [Pseudonocardia terrae]
MRDAVIVDAVRTPVGRRKGALAEIHPAELSAAVLRALAARTGLDPADVDDVVWGNVTQGGDQASNVGRWSVLAAGWPETVPATTVHRVCGSGQQAVHFAAAGLVSGQYDVAVAGGVESMTRVPMGSTHAGGQVAPPSVLERFGVDGFSQGLAAEMVAEKWGLSRTELDEYALRSHSLAAAATDAGAFTGQLVPVGGLIADEGIRRGGSVESLAKLKPVFKEDGVIHAGNSSQVSDGTAGVLMMTSEAAAARGLTPIARVHSAAVAGDDPVLMLTAPIGATAKVLRRAGLTLEDIGVYEVNEAFAPVPLVWRSETGADAARLNPLGGAIAVGHPLGASGAILLTRMVHHMRDNGIRYGLQTICEAGGLANAIVVENLHAER